MLRIHGDRISLLAALTAHWAEQQLQLPQANHPRIGPIRIGADRARQQTAVCGPELDGPD